MSAAIHPFPGRDPNRPLSDAGDDLLAELAAAVGAARRDHPAGRGTRVGGSDSRRAHAVSAVSAIGAARRDGANDLVAVPAHVSPAMRRRRHLALAFAAVLLAVLVAAGSGMNGARADGPVATVDTVTVEGGDTLWGIASDLTPADGDVRVTVARLLEANELATPTVHVGTVLQVPAPLG